MSTDENNPLTFADTHSPLGRFDFDAYRGQVEWVRKRTIFVTRHGSHAYGTNTPTSDLDLRAICIPPASYYHGNLHRFEQTQNPAGDTDFVIFGINKWFQIAVECNPNALELLFTDESDHLHVSRLGEHLLANRRHFLTKRVKHTFSGYAHSQLKRIQRHYRWLKDPPTAPPTRVELGLPERTVIPADQLAAANAAIQKQLDRWNFVGLEDVSPDVRIGLQGIMAELLAEMHVAADETWRAAARTIGISDNFIELLDIERRYLAKKREWDQYQTWVHTRNPERAALEAKFGLDTKHAMHLVRLLRVCREILTTGEMRVRRPDAEELLSIRNGAWSYERLVDFAEREDRELTELAKTARHLANDPPRAHLDRLLISIVEAGLG